MLQNRWPQLLSTFLSHITIDFGHVFQFLLQFPEKKEDWQKIAGEFSERCDFPNCGGSLNARHVSILKTGESKYHGNHHGYCSVVLGVLVDANHRFIHAEVISELRESDEEALLKTEFIQHLVEDSLDLPDNIENEENLDFVFTAPNSFPLHKRILMMYPASQINNHDKLTFNDKVRTVNRFSDNALGLMASRFGIFRSAITVKMWKVELIVRACCAIHNFLSVESKQEYISETTYDHPDEAGNMVLGEWRHNTESSYRPLQSILHYSSPETDHIREQYADYFKDKIRIG